MQYGHWLHGSVRADDRVLGNFVRTRHESTRVDILIFKRIKFGVLKTHMLCIKFLGLHQRMVFLCSVSKKNCKAIVLTRICLTAGG
jgi:hypothetical protein